MIQMMLYSMTFIMSLIFLQMNHPLAMGLVLLMQTVLICLITGLMTKTFWFSYILFLIFLGGMLVLFIYVTSLASNEMFTLSSSLFMISAAMYMLSICIIMITDTSLLSNYLNNMEMMNISTSLSFIPENYITLTKLYNFPTNMITILLINYLLISLIVMVKITNYYSGPLRPMK